MNRRLACLLLVLPLIACNKSSTASDAGGTTTGGSGSTAGGTTSGSSSTGGSTGSTGDAGPIDAGPIDAGDFEQCDAHASGPSHMTDSTIAWNLGDGGLNLTGNRIIAADLDGDGYPDLIVHAIYTNARSLVPLSDGGTGPLYEHVLMNRPNPNGGRMFVDATVESGVFQVRAGQGLRSAQLAVAADIDNDGDLDLFSGTYTDPTHPETDPGDRSEVLINDGTGHFTLAPISDAQPQASQLWPTTGATFTDVDHDGKLDLFVGFWYRAYGSSEYGVPAQLYRGNGDGTFASITNSAGVATSSGLFTLGNDQNPKPAYGVTACDVNGDGSPELMISAYGRQWNNLYLNDGTGHFAEVGQDSGYAGDENLDYTDNQFFLCYCTVHPTAAGCADAGAPLIQCPTPADADWSAGSDDQPWRLNGNTFSTLCADITGDGIPDLYSAEIRHWHIGNSSDPSELLVGDGHAHFTRPGNANDGLVMPHPTSDWNEGALMVAGPDLDNDGRRDLVVAASDYPDQFGWVFHQLTDGGFEEVGQDWGMHHPCMSGLAVADFDRDGDLDVIVGSGTARDCSAIWHTNEVHIYTNDASTRAHAIEIRLRGDGVTANRMGAGAKVTVEAGGVTQVQELQTGFGHMAMEHDTVLHFGLGECAGAANITVTWPDAVHTTQTWTRVLGDQLIELQMGDPSVHQVVSWYRG
ncbi:MAG: CRTAC1 family protein [Deltaproteobacteria bacterium]|nr:CRTAC1 family protein [Deltaproteobacteria bacterium]